MRNREQTTKIAARGFRFGGVEIRVSPLLACDKTLCQDPWFVAPDCGQTCGTPGRVIDRGAVESVAMPITYTNRKGITYYLCRGSTKTGRERHYFARKARGEPVEELPAGFVISESVNGVVSLIRDRPSGIWPTEVALIERTLKRHPQAMMYRIQVKDSESPSTSITGH
jgi:hypothetical protein